VGGWAVKQQKGSQPKKRRGAEEGKERMNEKNEYTNRSKRKEGEKEGVGKVGSGWRRSISVVVVVVVLAAASQGQDRQTASKQLLLRPPGNKGNTGEAPAGRRGGRTDEQTDRRQ
jgi:hypothetical protein